MLLAFLSAALAAGFTAAGLATLALWVVSLLSGDSTAWGVAPWVVAAAGLGVTLLTLVAEGVAHRRMQARMRSRAAGEPWAYRR